MKNTRESGEDIDQVKSWKNRAILGQKSEDAIAAEGIVLMETLEGYLRGKKIMKTLIRISKLGKYMLLTILISKTRIITQSRRGTIGPIRSPPSSHPRGRLLSLRSLFPNPVIVS